MFFKKDNNKIEATNLSKVAALLIHAGKIDEHYSKEEEKIIKETLLKIGAKEDNIRNILKEAKEIESNANQILDFTQEVKNMDEKKK